ncbi:Vegetative incompatibility protein HET-E-1-like protein 15 [Botrytis cinerea]
METSGVIFEATAACIQSFKACLAAKALTKNEWAENRLADFNLWASGIGASTRSRASLDSRLALRPETRNVIANVLRLLAATVDKCTKLGEALPPSVSGQLLIDVWGHAAISGTTQIISELSDDEDSRGRQATLSPEESTPRSFSPWSDASDTQLENEVESLCSSDPLHKTIKDVEMMLDQLARIAVAVRRSGRRSRLQKADQRFKPAEHEELQKHLTTVLLARPEFSEDQIDVSKLSEIQQRLVHCNLMRRNRLLYAQQHSIWLDTDAAARLSQGQANNTRPTASEEPAKEKQKSLPLTTKPSSEAPAVLANPTIRTGTSASAVSDSVTLPLDVLPVPAASTIMSSTVINLKYPRPPKIEKGARIFMCPCCCQTLPVTLSEGNRWKKHVADDLSPYTCILPDCVNPEVLFSTKETWRQHLLEGHQSFEYWVCFVCGDEKRFQNEDAFTEHTKTIHAASVKPDQIPLLRDICKRSTPMEIRSCPLCNWPDGEKGTVDQGVLLDHIAIGIHSFSLRALPWADDNGQETDERINSSANKVYDWLATSKLLKDPRGERPSRDSKVYYSEHFQRHAYFANSSAASSSSELESDDSIKKELNKWKKEGSVSFGSRESEYLSKDGAGNETVPYSQIDFNNAIGVNASMGAALQTLEGHAYSVTSVAFSPDSKQIVSGSWDDTVKLWDTMTGAILYTLKGHTEYVTSVAFSPDGKQIVSGSWDKTVKLWDTITGAMFHTLDGHTSFVTSVAFSPDGKLIVSGSSDDTVKLWDTMTGAILYTLKGHTSSITSVAFSPNSKQIVSGSWDCRIQLWDTMTGAILQTLEGHTGRVNSVAFSPDGKQVVSGSDDNVVRLWDTATGLQIQPTLEVHTNSVNSVNSVAFSPDGKQVVSGSDDDAVRLWDTATGLQIQPMLEGHKNSVNSVAFSPDGKQVVSGSFDTTVRLWNIAIE